MCRVNFRITAVIAVATLIAALFVTAPAWAARSLTLMIPGDTSIQQLFEWHVEQFKKAHPDVDVTIIMANAQDQIDKTNVMLAAGTPPDMIWTSNRYATGWLEGDMFYDLNDFMKRDNIQGRQFVPAALVDLQWNGKQSMLPMDVDVNHLFYLNDPVAEAGLADINDVATAGGWTYETFVDYAKRMTKDTNGDGKVDYWGLALGLSTGFIWEPEYSSWIFSVGGDILDSTKTQERVSQPAAVRGLEYMLRLRHEFEVVAASGWTTQVMNGQAAMCSSATFWGKSFSTKFATTATVRPKVEGHDPVHTLLINGVGIFRGSREVELAWEFLKQVVSLEGQSKLVEITGRVPGYLPALSVWQRLYSQQVQGAEQMVTNITQLSRPLPINKYWVDVTNLIQDALKQLWAENKPVAPVMEDIGRQIMGILQS